MRTALVLAAALVATRAWAGAPDPLPVTESQRQRIDALLGELSLAEKLNQLTMQWGGEVQDTNPGARQRAQDEIFGVVRGGIGTLLGAHGAAYTNRLQEIATQETPHGIPLLLGNDVIHGYRTIFPIPLGEAASWNVALVQEAARVAAVEARAAGTHWTFAPMIDICRDARWGRIAETSGEDPYLASVLAAARVHGFQGEGLSRDDALLACGKHYVAYGAAEAGRDYNTVDISLATLHEIHLPPFRAAVDAGCATLMSAFNEISGVPASGNVYTLQTVLRENWGFQGLVVSDWTSITEMIAHGYAADPADAARIALAAGIDVDMCSFSYRDKLPELIAAGRVPSSLVDDALRRLLRAKFAAGLFNDPRSDPALEERVTLSAAHRAVARRLAGQSCVLLRNEGDLLPIGPEVRRIALIGPMVDNDFDPLGTWKAIGKKEDVVTVLAGIQARENAPEVRYEWGCDFRGDDRTRFEAALEAVRASDLAVVVVGEPESMSGEAHSRSNIGLPGPQLALVEAVHATGKPVVVVLLAGRPLAVPWVAENIPAIVMAWHPGVECGNAIADVLFGDVNPSGKLPATFPRVTGQVPIYYNHKNTGRPPNETRFTSKYIDVPSTPLFPFGHGLSYTTFDYADLAVSGETLRPGETVSVSATVRNSGARAGAEVVQLYIQDPVASMTRPVRELKGFQRIVLEPGEQQTVRFELDVDAVAFFDLQGRRVREAGEIRVWVGGSSVGGLEGGFRVVDAEGEGSTG